MMMMMISDYLIVTGRQTNKIIPIIKIDDYFILILCFHCNLFLHYTAQSSFLLVRIAFTECSDPDVMFGSFCLKKKRKNSLDEQLYPF